MSLINYKCQCKRNSVAYRLLTDHTFLLSLLHSKYGDIREDYNISYINKIFYGKTSPFLILYKEHQYNNTTVEFLKRYYLTKESKERVPKLSEYYKNYHLFFCRPLFRNWILCELMNNYGDYQAEVFYKVNYAKEINEKSKQGTDDLNDNIENKCNYESSSLDSIDGVKSNKTIFDKKTRLIIDKLTNAYQRKEGGTSGNNKYTITMTLDSSRLNTNALYSKRSKNNSFMNLINGIIQQTQKQKQGIDIRKSNTNKKQNCVLKCNHNNNNKHHIHHTNIPQQKVKSFRMKSSLCTLTKVHMEKQNNIHNNNQHHNNHISCSVISTITNNNNNVNVNINPKKTFISPRLKPYLTTFKSNIGEFNKHKPKYNYNTKKHSTKQHTNNLNSITNTHTHTQTQPLPNTTTYNKKQPPNTYKKPSTYRKIYYNGINIKKHNNTQNTSAKTIKSNKTFTLNTNGIISSQKNKNQTPNNNTIKSTNGINISIIKCNKNKSLSIKKHKVIHSADALPSSSSSVHKNNSINCVQKKENKHLSNSKKKKPKISFTNTLSATKKKSEHPILNSTCLKGNQTTRGVNRINTMYKTNRVRSESLQKKGKGKIEIEVKSRNANLKQKQNLHFVRSSFKNKSNSNVNIKVDRKCKSKDDNKCNEIKLKTYEQINILRNDIKGNNNSIRPINVNINMNLKIHNKRRKNFSNEAKTNK